MKGIKRFLFAIIFFVSVLPGCKKDKAESPVPIERLKAFSGKNRAKVEFQVPADAKSGKVFYGAGNFKEFTVSDASAIQQVIVDSLPEDEQMLRVVTINSDGLSSDPRGVKVKVYGAKYLATLKPRKWADQTNNAANSINLAFDAAAADETGVWIVYTKTTGGKDSAWMDHSINVKQVDNIDVSEPYYYYSVFKPVAESIDEFHSTNVDLQTALMLNFKKDTWVIDGFSDEEAGQGAANIIDNNISTSWHYQANTAGPHWVTIDMGSPKIIDGFFYVNHQGNANQAKSVRFELSDDNNAWTTVLNADLKDNFLRQRLALTQSKTGRYIRVTVLESWNPAISGAQLAEIDAYNNQNVSADNGKDSYTTSTAIALVNAKKPFQGDGTNPFPPLGEFRMQRLLGWSHSSNATVTYDNNGSNFSLFTANVWGLPAVTNGKVYQTVTLQPGRYMLKIETAGADGPVDIYGLVTASGPIPDYTAVTTSASTMKYLDLIPNQNKTVELLFAVTQASQVNIGFVYNIRDQYGATGTPWSSFTINGLALSKVE